MPDYSKTVIYKIVCKDETVDYLYVGSTTDLKRRKREHKSSCNNINCKKYNQKNYKEIRDHNGFENFEIIKIEDYPCDNNREAEAREEELRIELKADMNSQRCYTTDEQKEEQAKEYKKKYYDLNREKVKVRSNEYYKNNKEKASEKMKEYYYLNRENNKDKLKEKFDCECGGKYTYSYKSAHIKTAKHQNYINNL